MRKAHLVNILCFVICVVSIVAATLVGLLAVWGVFDAQGDFFWRLLVTSGIAFTGSAITMSVLKVVVAIHYGGEPERTF